MLGRVKQSIIQSYVGAIAIGLIFSQAISHFVGTSPCPLSSWFTRWSYRGFPGMSTPTAFPVETAVPEFVRSVLLLIIGYLLLRWLYMPWNDKVEVSEPTTSD